MMGSVVMRKTLSIALVGVMILSLFGFFGGVVEEVESAVIYDSNNNTIYITGLGNSLASILALGNASIYYLESLNTYVTNANIQVNGSSDFTINAGETLKVNSSLRLTVMGILFVNGVQGNMARFISNNTTPSKGDWQGLVFNTSEASNSLINYLNVSYAVEGIFCDGSSPAIMNSEISMCSDFGIYATGSSPQISSTEFSAIGDGIGLDSALNLITSSPLVENSTFLNNDRDFLIQSDSHPISLNTTFSLIFILDVNSNLTVKWYLEVYVEDDNSLLPVNGASIIIKDVFGNPIEGSPFTSNIQGMQSWIQVIEYVDSTSPTEFHTPHNISVTHPEYYLGFAEPEPYIGSSMQVQVNLSMIRRDLTTNEENITFIPSGVPVAGEDLTIRAIIHNIEVDLAQDVRVIIEDEGLEIHNSTITISGNSNQDAIEIWQPTPGQHTIWVYIDPFNDIMEINSNPLIFAEENNNVSVNIDVNARPWINITDPDENEEVNGTYLITGDAYDDPNDAPVGNDVSQIDIRLIGYDWISLFFPFNIVWNGTPGGWDWFYSWDTTEWNGAPISDGNYTLQARAWDGYHFSYLYEANISVNNTSLNDPPVAIINEPLNNSLWSVNETITFNGTLSFDPNNDTLTYVWDFDDGNFTTGNVTTHFFTQKGTYIVSLTVNDTQEENTAFVTVDVDNTPPYAAVTSSTDTAYVNETIIFYGYNSSDEETPNALTFIWDFDDSTDSDGDGNFTNDVDFFSTSPIENTTHFYTTPGIYVVTLTVNDTRINSTDTVIVTIDPNDPPNAIINQPINGQIFDVNETIFFNGSVSSDPNDENLTYFWDFGDGTNSSWLNESTTTHVYLEKGFNAPLYNYTVTLTVRDDEGLEGIDFISIRVNNYPPVANASSNVTTSPTNQDINFDATASYDPEGFGISSYLWDFDDGNTSSSDIIDHLFAQDGIYNVTLTVVDNFGANDTDWIIITILNRDPVIDSVLTTPDSPGMNEEIAFNVSASDDDGIIVKYQWDFGDPFTYWENTTDFGDGVFDGKTNHSYSSRDTYTVIITVWDDDGATNTTQITVEIANSPPEVIITSPNKDAQVLSSVVIEGTASDSDGSVSLVEIRIDNDPWESALGTSSWSYTWDTTPYINGQHTIYARAYDGEDYTDPLASVTINVTNPKTSITVTEFLNPSSIEQGGEVEVSGDVKYNTGEPVENADINVTIMNEPDFWLTTTDSNGFYTVTITAPNDTGSYWIEVEAETSSFTDSTQERLSVQVPPTQPDLEITSSGILFSDSNPYSGDSITITINVKNLGSGDADNVVVNGYYGDPQEGNPLSPEGTKTISSIGGGQDGFATFNWDTSNIVGQYDIYMVVDPGNSISESDEDNNRAFKTISILGRPDFTLDDSDIEFSIENPIVGDSITIFIKIHNEGSEKEYVTYEVYDGDPDSDGILIESGQEEIDIGEDSDIMVDWLVDEPGEHVIFVVLSTKSGVEESDDTNNEAYRSITVEKEEVKDTGLPPIIYLIIVLVIVVIIILFFLYKRGKGEEPEKKLPVATVVSGKATVVETEEEEEKKTMMEGQGGVRL